MEKTHKLIVILLVVALVFSIISIALTISFFNTEQILFKKASGVTTHPASNINLVVEGNAIENSGEGK